MAWDRKIPIWESDGSMAADAPRQEAKRLKWSNGKYLWEQDTITWVDVYAFTGVLHYDRMSEGVVWLAREPTRSLFPMTFNDFDGLMREGRFIGTRIEGLFTFMKRGPVFRIVPGERMLKCVHCKKTLRDHVGTQCLFDSTQFQASVTIEVIA